MTKPVIAPRPTKSVEQNIPSVSASKQWKIPPRPKPGRKPERSLQTNMEAVSEAVHQRAFSHEKSLKNQLNQSTQQISQLRDTVEKLQSELSTLKSASPKLNSYGSNSAQEGYNSSITATSQQQKHSGGLGQTQPKHHESSVQTQAHTHGDDCGLCDEGGGCMCDDLGLKPKDMKFDTTSVGPLDFENFEPIKAVPLPKRKVTTKIEKPTPIKRFKRLEPQAVVVAPAPQLDSLSHPSAELGDSNHDSCGFCSKDTPCLCVDTSANTTPQHTVASPSSSKQQNASPTSRQSNSSGSGSACGQCRQDPMQMLFCTSLNSKPMSKNANFAAAISCSDAYQSLSGHKMFETTDLGELVNLLDYNGVNVSVGSVSKALRYMNKQ